MSGLFDMRQYSNDPRVVAALHEPDRPEQANLPVAVSTELGCPECEVEYRQLARAMYGHSMLRKRQVQSTYVTKGAR
jgi:hypothetical protein